MSTATAPKTRVLVVDDSITMRNLVVEVLSALPGIEIVGEAADGLAAVQEAKRLEPDLITMDVRMPRMDGIEAIRRIMTERPTRIVVVCAVAAAREGELSMSAIEAGALELVAKPGTATEDLARFARRLGTSVRLMAGVPVVRRRTTAVAPPRPRSNPPGGALYPPRVRPSIPRSDCAVDVVAIAASTGGPPALATILGALPATYPLPVLVAQHMAPGFGDGLLRWLATVSALPVRVARNEENAIGGVVYLPPDGFHLEVEPGGVLRIVPTDGGHCPSGDRLLASVALAFRNRAAGLVLTGMGEDGARGLQAIAREGGITWAQDEETSIVYGMPKAAIDRGAASASLPLHRIADALLGLAKTHA